MKRLLPFLALASCLCFGAQDFPLVAHVKKIEQDQKLAKGTTMNYHLLTAVIDGRTYGLEVKRLSWHTMNSWIHVGDYPCRRTKQGFDLQYTEDGKLHAREFVIVSEGSD
jgi:hypothetical protein